VAGNLKARIYTLVIIRKARRYTVCEDTDSDKKNVRKGNSTIKRHLSLKKDN
jgi:hypothetical protein